jgi:hypothetical protein
MQGVQQAAMVDGARTHLLEPPSVVRLNFQVQQNMHANTICLAGLAAVLTQPPAAVLHAALDGAVQALPDP